MIPRYYDIVVNPHNREIPNEGINRWYQLAVNVKNGNIIKYFFFLLHTQKLRVLYFLELNIFHFVIKIFIK